MKIFFIIIMCFSIVLNMYGLLTKNYKSNVGKIGYVLQIIIAISVMLGLINK